MGKWLLSEIVFVAILLFIASHGMATDTPNGAELFKQHCLRCHPIAAVMRDSRIVEIMRKPTGHMPKFDKDQISDNEASAIADYIKLQIALKSICEAK
jgi:mono/diheme cytochrome c family protein